MSSGFVEGEVSEARFDSGTVWSRIGEDHPSARRAFRALEFRPELPRRGYGGHGKAVMGMAVMEQPSFERGASCGRSPVISPPEDE